MKPFQKIAILLTLSLLCTASNFAQSVTSSHLMKEGVRYIDLSKSQKIKSVTIDLDSVKLGYPSCVSVNNKGKLITSYIKLSSNPQIILKRSDDGGLTWSEREYPTIEHDKKTRVASLFAIDSRKGEAQLNLIKGAGVFQQSISLNGGKTWGAMEPVNGFGGFRITDMFKTKSGSHIALFNDDGRFITNTDSVMLNKPVIYQIVSTDEGRTWSLPEVILKHNIYGLTEASVARHTRRGNTALVMITSEPISKAAMVSFSNDEGNTWSYPVELPPILQGDRHRIYIEKEKVYIVFRDTKGIQDTKTINNTFGDLMMWVGEIRDLHEGTKGEACIRIADNYPVETADPNDLNTIDCGYPSIVPSHKRTVAVVAYGQWMVGKPAFIKCFVFSPESILW